MSMTQFFMLLGGVGLFLYGMTIMSSGLQSAAGDKVRVILEKATANKVLGILLGFCVTILIQSSSATDMMVIGFVNSGLMNLGQAIAVIMGANIGTTITAQITAFDLTMFAPLLLLIGVIMFLFIKKPVVKSIGMIILGFGMLFVGVGNIKAAIKPLSELPQFTAFLERLSNPFLAVLFGVAFTALLQSSSSSTVIFQAFVIQGILSYRTAVYLVIGAAIGSVTPNLLAGLTTNRNGKRSAVLNLIFNLMRAALLMVIIGIFPQVLDFIEKLSPNDPGRMVANTHTIFAITAVIILFPISGLIVKLAQKLIPPLPEETRMAEEKKLHYLNTTSTLPTVMIKQAFLECERMGNMASDNLRKSLECFFMEGDPSEMIEEIEGTESVIDFLCKEISNKLIEIKAMNLSAADSFRASKLMIVATNYERIGDHAENIIEFRQKLDQQHERMSDEARADLRKIADKTLESVELSIPIFANEDSSRLGEAEDAEEMVDRLQEELTENHVKRLMDRSCDPMAGIVFTDIVTDLERCSDNALNVAYALFSKDAVEI